jgi:mycofactocin system glycosyltransferase
VRVLGAGRVLLGGDPGRLVRLSAAGAAVLSALGDLRTPAQQALGRRLLDGGLVHPVPGPVEPADVTVLVPVRDRADELDRCLAALGAGVPVLVVDDGSDDPAALARVCAGRARLLRLPVNGGPGAARNAGLAATGTGIVAFLDSDCTPGPDWLTELLGHFADPSVAAVAPRVRAAGGPSLLARYARARGPLDLGPRPARVRPGGRVPYVPTAALLVRRSALPARPFEPGLRYGEDVDLVWRLHDAGGVVRYDPRTVVGHAEPARWSRWLARRYRYGTSAAPLAARHGDRLAPLVLPPWPTAAWLLLLAGQPGPALAVAAVPVVRLLRALRRTGLPISTCGRAAAATVARGMAATAGGLGGAGAVVTGPLLLGMLALRRTRPAAATALLVPPLLEWYDRRPAVDPVRWAALRLVDDLAYAAGVWRGCLAARTLAPLRPRTRRPG